VILPTGRLQEAGCIIWGDGVTMGIGRGLDPEDPTVMVRRDVDYCSGAFLMTPRRAWERLGGFDEAYAPAYYEDADYCMRLRRLGLRVVYEPTAIVDHYELGSQAKTGDAAAMSERNRAIFVERHAAALNRHGRRGAHRLERAVEPRSMTPAFQSAAT
jgi:GT2 family glycosyltransferase